MTIKISTTSDLPFKRFIAEKICSLSRRATNSGVSIKQAKTLCEWPSYRYYKLILYLSRRLLLSVELEMELSIMSDILNENINWYWTLNKKVYLSLLTKRDSEFFSATFSSKTFRSTNAWTHKLDNIYRVSVLNLLRGALLSIWIWVFNNIDVEFFM